MIGSKELTHFVRFERQSSADDGHGNTVAAWETISGLSEVGVRFWPEKGRERIEAGRLEATMLGTLTVRFTDTVAAVTAADRVVFLSGGYAGKAFQIRSEPVPTPNRTEIDFVIESGVAQG